MTPLGDSEMARHKINFGNTREWAELLEDADDSIDRFEKLRHHQQRMTDRAASDHNKRKQQFHRSRWN
jgi:hypothetical protein